MATHWFDEANACFLAGQYDEAETLYRQILQSDPWHVGANNNLGVILSSRGRHEEAIEHYHRVLACNPHIAATYNCLGNALLRLGRPQEAADSFTQAIRLSPNFAQPHNALGLAYLLMGDYERGWPEYEWRWGIRDFVEGHIETSTPWAEYEARWLSGLPVPFAEPRWDGSPLAGRTILLFAEQGFGDVIQFIRYAPLVKERGGTVIVHCQAELLSILASCGGIDQLLPRGTPPLPFDVHAPLPSLPGIFGTTVSTIPAKAPYLHADARLVEHWRQQLPPEPAFKVGIVWQGRPHLINAAQRSISLAEFAPLAAVPGVHLISLQKGHGRQQLETLQGRFPIIDFGDRMDEESGPFMDTAAILQNLDLAIVPDTSIAHLAGALGIKVWIALPSTPDWRWLLDRSDSPWYPTARLFRQQRAGDWTSVFAQMATELRQLVGKQSGKT